MQFVESAGARLRCESRGTGSTVIALHGGPGAGFDYLVEDFTPIFSQERIVFYDQRSTGRSRAAEASLTMPRFIADLERVREFAGEERVHLAGHSFGGLLALSYAIAHPERVSSLVLFDPDPPSWLDWSRYADVVRSRLERVPRSFEEMLAGYLARPERASELAARFDSAARENLAHTSPAFRRNNGRYDLRRELRRIDKPTLIVSGSHTPFPPESMVELHRLVRGSRLVVLPSCGHFPQFEARDEVMREVRLFLEIDSGRVESHFSGR